MSLLYQISVREIYAKDTTRILLSSFVRYACVLCNLHNSILSSQCSTCQVVPKISSPVRDYSANSHVARTNWLITKLGKEGKIGEARRVFEEMPDRDVVSWTAVIQGYIECGMIEEARKLFDRIDAMKNVVTWTAVIGGYVRLNRIEEARSLFDAMPVKNVQLWNTMIEGYAQKGCVDQAFDLFKKMPERNVVSWNIVIIALMQCKRVDEAQELFNQMLEKDVISWTTMLSGLSKNGRIDDARLLFDKMPKRDVVSWTAMISGYVQYMRLDEAFELFEQMPERDVLSWNIMITGFIKNRKLERAVDLFYKMPNKDVFIWKAMISGHVQDGQSEEALKIFSEMQADNNVKPNEGIFVSVLRACSNLAGLCEGQQIHQIISKSGYQEVADVVSALINMYSKCGELDMAWKIFDDGSKSHRDVVCWNTVITALMQYRRVDEAQELFNQMPERNVLSWMAMVSGLSKNGRIDDARLLFDKMPKRNVVSWNTMITGYAQNMRVDEAFELFEQMPEKDVPSWNTMITGFIQNGKLERAVDLFYKMPDKDAVTWTTMISGYVQGGQSEEALKIFSEMQAANNVKPNEGTFVSVLGACCNLAGLCEGQQIHQIISKSGYQEIVGVASALINMYSKCGELDIARKIFDDGSKSHRDVVSWNGMIAAYAHHGHGYEAICLFDEMQALGFYPDSDTYNALLSACSHAGLVDEGLKYFENLVRDGSIKLRENHFTCLVDLFARAGRLQEAFDFIKGLEVKPSADVWAALLAGCNVHGNIDIGKRQIGKQTTCTDEITSTINN